MRNYASPMFEQRHYAAIAKIMAETKPARELTPLHNQWAATLNRMSDMFRADNPRYSQNRFYLAANGNPSNGKDRRL